MPNRQTYLSPKVQAIRDDFPPRLWSQFVNLLVRSSKINKDEPDRDLAERELELFLEKIGA